MTYLFALWKAVYYRWGEGVENRELQHLATGLTTFRLLFIFSACRGLLCFFHGCFFSKDVSGKWCFSDRVVVEAMLRLQNIYLLSQNYYITALFLTIHFGL